MSNVEFRPEIKDGSPVDDATVEKSQDAYRSSISINELWSLDETFTDYILPRIRAFREMDRHGYPVLDEECTPKNARQLQNGDDAAFDDSWDAADWENILFDIEKGFEAHQNLIGYGDAFGKTTEENEKVMQKGLNLFAKYYGHLWD